jgi:hypothetical protein
MAVANMMESTVKQNSDIRRVRGMRPQHVSFLSIPWLYIRRGDTLGSFLQSIWVSHDSIRILSTVARVCLLSEMLPPLGHICSVPSRSVG